MDLEQIADYIYEHMQDDRLTMNKVANMTDGISISQVSRVLHGENYKIKTLMKILESLDLELQITRRIPNDKDAVGGLEGAVGTNDREST